MAEITLPERVLQTRYRVYLSSNGQTVEVPAAGVSAILRYPAIPAAEESGGATPPLDQQRTEQWTKIHTRALSPTTTQDGSERIERAGYEWVRTVSDPQTGYTYEQTYRHTRTYRATPEGIFFDNVWESGRQQTRRTSTYAYRHVRSSAQGPAGSASSEKTTTRESLHWSRQTQTEIHSATVDQSRITFAESETTDDTATFRNGSENTYRSEIRYPKGSDPIPGEAATSGGDTITAQGDVAPPETWETDPGAPESPTQNDLRVSVPVTSGILAGLTPLLTIDAARLALVQIVELSSGFEERYTVARGTLIRVTTQRGVRHYGLELEAQETAQAGPVGYEKVLAGVYTYSVSGDDNQRTIAGPLDLHIRPGDRVSDTAGAITLAVEEISYTIGPRQSSMELRGR